tara:strand:+ start:1211 stop:1957 length:747 start_codon:yes stop_codon:yes gene_type:complete
MNINLKNFTYSRYVDIDLSIDMLRNYTKNKDYTFMVSHNELIKDDLKDFENVKKISAVIDILEDDDLQLMKCHSTTRNEIRRTFKSNDFEVFLNPKVDKELLNFYNKCEWERGWIPVPSEELKASIIIGVKYQGNYIAGMSAYHGREIMRIARIFSRRKSAEHAEWPQVIFAACSKRVVFEYTKLCRDMGLSALDLGGIDFSSSAKSGISKYKMSFGSKEKDVRIYRFKGTKFNDLNEEINKMERDLT